MTESKSNETTDTRADVEANGMAVAGEKALPFYVCVRDRRGSGVRRIFGPYAEPPSELVDQINDAATADDAPTGLNGAQVISASVGWIHPPDRLTLENALSSVEDRGGV